MKEILVDIYKIKDMHSGLGQFSMNFAKELINRLPKDLKVDFLVPKVGKVDLAGENVNIVEANLQKRYLPSFNKEYFIWHSLQQFPSHFPNKKSKFILTIPDLNFLIEKDQAKGRKYLRQLQKNVDRASHITTISNYVKEQIEEHIDLNGKKVHMIYVGINSDPGINNTKPVFMGEKKFFFSIGIFNPKKNFHSLVPLMNQFKDYQLIIAGNKETPYGREVQAEIDNLNLTDRIILPGKISESDKSWLYANCHAFLFPSLAEGFGMPVIEAMNWGKPIFLSRYTSLPEIGGDIASYFDDFDELHMSNIIRDKLLICAKDEEKFSLETKKYAERFSWHNCLTEYLKLYSQIE